MVCIPSWLTRLGARLANRPFIFTFAVSALFASKLAHIHSHRNAVATGRLLTFFSTFFVQDILVLLLIRLLLDQWSPRTQILHYATTAVAGLLILYNVALSLISITFYIVSGAEIHWRNLNLVSDPTSRAIFLSGLVTFILVASCLVVLAWLLQNVCYRVFGWGADMIHFPWAMARTATNRFLRKRNIYSPLPDPEPVIAEENQYDDIDDEAWIEDFVEHGKSQTLYSRISQRVSAFGVRVQPSTVRRIHYGMPYFFWSLFAIVMLVLLLERPDDRSLLFLSWTTGLLPFVDVSSTAPLLDQLPSKFEQVGIQHQWDEKSALGEPPKMDWLPKGKPLAGFEDWYTPNELHYNAAKDPMKISNLDQPVLEELKDKLKDVSVKHVMLFLLESTRNDVFPFKKGGHMWEKFKNSYPDKKIPADVEERLKNLMPNARYVTGDYDDGFKHDKTPKRGGAHFSNAYTSGTYTLKSLVGTICGLNPLIADFNLDYKRHIYQPCLPHIFDAMNKAEDEKAAKWKSYFFQTAMIHYDNHHKLMAACGYPEENTQDRDSLRSENAKHRVDLEDINYFGFQEDPLEDYMRDAFNDAKENNGRVFLTHITSTSHHAYGIPKNETYTAIGSGKDIDEMSHYANAESYDDKWIGKVLKMLDDQGVANETLIVFLGDHGVSLVENGKASPYYNPSVGSDHVPLVFSHPSLPAFNVEHAVHSTQVLPTILDLMLESGSFEGVSRKAAESLVGNYEGQSLLRPMQMVNNQTGQAQWHFTVVNPGRAMLNVRDVRYPDRHLSVPLIDNTEWRLSDLAVDPLEKDPVQAFDYLSFLDSVEKKWGVEWAQWVEEGAFMTRWHVQENGKRWRYERNPNVQETRDQ
ncbi:hypothetical protein FACUT_8356 [Fusarium acutatum]|uniref:Sulfatase N-terminal domain-containing protein n=1 Tax=Fusarium acutatum TaxID=78861 RepID=A0A8H4NI51_9HYPO|nr:hypothetical protein FACUT_8356 [Fusarium acutatum]